VLLCAERGRLRLLGCATLVGLLALAPVLVADLEHPAQLATAGAATGTLWSPFQLLWPLGTAHHHVVPDGVGGTLALTTWTAPGWIGPASRALIVGLTAPLAAGALIAGRRSRADALLLLALLLHLRCALDPWNSVYYALPAALALVAWSVARGDRLPLAAALFMGLVWFTFSRLALVDDRAVMFAGFAAWAVPCALVLGRSLYGGPRLAAGAPARLPTLSPARP
jgi:hypothetical protein